MANVTNAAGTAANYIPKFNSASVISNSIIFQSATGNIGIGTITPAFKLDVNGILKMTGFNLSTTPTNGYVLTSDASGNGTWKPTVVSTGAANAISKFTGPNAIANSVINESAAGNIGIGTAAPGQKLSVNGTVESTLGGFKFPDGSVQSTMAVAGPPGPQGIPGPQGPQGVPGPAGGGGSTVISEANGYVGIGIDPTRSPQEKLTLAPDSNLAIEMPTPIGVSADISPVSGGMGAESYYFRVTASDGIDWTKASAQLVFNLPEDNYGIRVSWNPVLGATKYRVYRALTATGGYRWIETTNTYYDYVADSAFPSTNTGSPPEENTAYINKLSASDDSWLLGGNVGIGTTKPQNKLQVIDSDIALAGTDTANLVISSSSAVEADKGGSIGFGHAAGTVLGVIKGAKESSGANKGYLAFATRSDATFATEHMRIDSSGNVGIGTSNPQAKLDVNGTIKSPMWNVTQVFNMTSGPLPLGSPAPGWVSGGGTLLIFASGSGYLTSTIGHIGMNIRLVTPAVGDSVVGVAKVMCNEIGSQKAFTTNALVVTGIPAGTHFIVLEPLGNTITNVGDFFSVTVLELPF